jgi:hypothetical protein
MGKDKGKLKVDSFNDQLYSLNNFNRGFYSKLDDKYIWNKDFYLNSQYFDDANLNDIILDYLIGIIMIELLYTKIYKNRLSVEEKQIVELWYYSYHKSPLIIDIHKYLNDNIKNNIFDNDRFKNLIRNHLIKFLINFKKIVKITPITQLYYITPIYSDFIKITNADKLKYPILEEHKLYEEFISQLIWDKKYKTLNINKIIDCNGQRYIDKCIPLLKSKIDNKYINLIFNINSYL